MGANLPLILKFLIFGRVGPENHLKRIAGVGRGVLVVIEQLLKSVEVEAVADVLLVDLTEKLVVLEVAEPAYPSVALL